jgi:hypothetical protein
MKRKFLSAWILLLMMVFMAAAGGCGGGGSDSTDDPSPIPTPIPDPTPPDPDPTPPGPDPVPDPTPPGPTAGNWIDVAVTSWYNPSENVFEISTPEQLAGVAKLVNEWTDLLSIGFRGKTIRLVADIDLAGREWTPIGSGSNYSYFYGIFDGNGHTIANMTVNAAADEFEYAGLFGYNNSGTIKNVTLSDAVVSSSFYTGGLAGLNGGTIEGCAISGRVSASTSNASTLPIAGGIAGTNLGGTIKDCTVSSSVSSTITTTNTSSSRAGGLVGENHGTIESCTASGSVSASASTSSFEYSLTVAGGLVGENRGTIKGCTASGKDIRAINNPGSEAYTYRGGLIGWTLSGPKVIITNNRNETGVTPAIGFDERETPDGPSDNI